MDRAILVSIVFFILTLTACRKDKLGIDYPLIINKGVPYNGLPLGLTDSTKVDVIFHEVHISTVSRESYGVYVEIIDSSWNIKREIKIDYRCRETYDGGGFDYYVDSSCSESDNYIDTSSYQVAKLFQESTLREANSSNTYTGESLLIHSRGYHSGVVSPNSAINMYNLSCFLDADMGYLVFENDDGLVLKLEVRYSTRSFMVMTLDVAE